MDNRKIVLWIVLIISAAFFACAQPYETENNFSVVPLDGGRSVKIIGYTGSNWTIRIPPRIRGLPVTNIGEKAFLEKNLISVTIPNSVTVIGDMAFANNQLTNITIPNSVLTIGHSAFSDNRITDITIINNEIEIWWDVFKGNDLTSITFQNGKKKETYTYSDEMWNKKYFGNSLFIQIGLERSNGTIFDPDFLDRMRKYSNVIRNIPIVEDIISLVNIEYIYSSGDAIIAGSLVNDDFSGKSEEITELKRRLLSWPVYDQVLFSDDFTATQILVSLSLRSRKSISPEESRHFKQISDIAQKIFSDHSTVYITGMPIISKNIINESKSKIISIVLEGNSPKVVLRPDTLSAMDGLSHYLQNNVPNVGVMGLTDLIKRVNQVFNANEPPEGLRATNSINYTEDFSFGFDDFERPIKSEAEKPISDLTNKEMDIMSGISYYEIPIDPKRYGKETSEELQRLISNYLVLLAGDSNNYANDPLEPTAIKSIVLLHNVSIDDSQMIFTKIQQYININFPPDVMVTVIDNTPWKVH